MTKRRSQQRIPLPKLVRVRRQVNHERDVAALLRLRSREDEVNRARRVPLPNQILYDYGRNLDCLDLGGIHKDVDGFPNENTIDDWTARLHLTEPDEVDIAIQDNLARLRQEALRLDWDSLVKHLHPIYMAQKLRTKNWTTPESYANFSNCNCQVRTRVVDLVDIYG